MAIRVAHIGTGNVGRIALVELIENPGFELTGLCVSADEKVGKDAGELAGLDVKTGILATKDLDAVLATEPECAVYCAMGDTRMPEAMEDVRKILAAGINVVGSSPGLLQYPWGVMPDKYIQRVEDAARQGNSSLFISGVDPGFVNDLIPLALASTCQRVEQVRCMEIHDYASYDGAEVMHYMGFARSMDEIPMLLQPGVLSIAWGTAIRQLAAGLGIEVDEITESYQREPAPEDFDIAVGHVAKGTLAVLQFEIRGMVNGHPAIVIEHITRLRPDLRPDLPQPAAGGGSYRIEITGEPSYAVDIVPSSSYGDHNQAAIAGAAGRIVNAIPAVIAAPPGIRTTLNLPLVSEVELFAKP
ncbi:NAD(P)H-dependent amine dehydrogenase family protein [Mycolicibacterium sp. ELW1]|uniref:NAD(P)H-dependent amine dehydrogenase family protein n=1 Tax=Mycobacteriaceae TaxID=1762 RepID=UPI0011F00E83|nr:diacylglycerol kinase [Mycobacterium sp. ELW1]QEN14230.1 diacylglycerol kinase [Mycobacterium sp. ELW1]